MGADLKGDMLMIEEWLIGSMVTKRGGPTQLTTAANPPAFL